MTSSRLVACSTGSARETFGPELGLEHGHSGDVAAGSREARHVSRVDRICMGDEDCNGDCPGDQACTGELSNATGVVATICI